MSKDINTPTTLRAVFYQYTAELKQGLNQLAGHDPIDQATQSIQEQLKGLLPEKHSKSNKLKQQYDIRDFMNGYNQAIEEIEKALEEWAR